MKTGKSGEILHISLWFSESFLLNLYKCTPCFIKMIIHRMPHGIDYPKHAIRNTQYAIRTKDAVSWRFIWIMLEFARLFGIWFVEYKIYIRISYVLCCMWNCGVSSIEHPRSPREIGSAGISQGKFAVNEKTGWYQGKKKQKLNKNMQKKPILCRLLGLIRS